MIQGGTKGTNGSGKSKNGKNKSGSDDVEDSSLKKKAHGVEPWMLEAPKNGDPKSITKNDKDYHWCPKCAKGAGQWVCHKPGDHSDDFKPKKNASNGGGSSDDSSKKKEKKQSAASSGNAPGSGTNGSSSNSGCSLQFNRSALLSVAAGNNADTQAFLSEFLPGKE